MRYRSITLQYSLLHNIIGKNSTIECASIKSPILLHHEKRLSIFLVKFIMNWPTGRIQAITVRGVSVCLFNPHKSLMERDGEFYLKRLFLNFI